MLVMSCSSTSNEPESCSSEGSSCNISSITTSDPSSMSEQTNGTLASLSDVPDITKHEAPPPPPLPPPPPGAPPPPPPPSTTSTNHNTRKKRRVRSFFWKPIPEEKVRGKPNIWTLAVRQQQYQIDVRSVEELFGQQEEAVAGLRGAAAATASTARVSRSRSFKESSKDEISILDSKRGMNVGIFLKQFKKSNRSIVEDIRRGEGKIYGAELLKDLLKLLPDTEEIKKLQAFKGDPDKLTLVDSFMYLLIQVPRFEVRIEVMVLQEEFFPSCAVMSREIDVVRVATKQLMSCEELHAILHLVLQAGNIMNAGGYAGNAVGFKLSSLLSLADTKANKPGMNLLHFVAMEAKKKDEMLLKFPEKLQDVQSAARISVENIELEFSSLYVRIKSLEEKIQGDGVLLQQLEPFLQSSVQTLQDLKRRRLDLRKEGNSLIDFFCEDKDTFKLDECFRIFQDFCIKFNKAVKDNMDRELKEAARQRRLKELEEKRFAWSAGDDQNSVFGRSSSENDVEMLTKEGLVDFFQKRSQSPHGALGRSSSARRHRHTLTSIADRELKGYLELFGSTGNPTDYYKFNSLPRSGRPVQRRTTPWILGHDDSRELNCNRQATSPHAETEPISPLARFSSSGLNDEDPYHNNNYSSVSESSVLPHSFCVFQKSTHLPNPTVTGHMNVSVEKHTLVRGPQTFDLPSPNNNSNHMRFVNQGDVLVTELEKERLSPPKSLDGLQNVFENRASQKAEWEGKVHSPSQNASSEKEREEEDCSTVSSTTCDTPLPLDTSVSNKKPVFYILDCTETDCSVTLDYSEVESSSLTKEGLRFRTDRRKDQEIQQDLSSLSSNVDSTSPNDLSVSVTEFSESKSVGESAAPSAHTEEWDTESCDTAEGKQAVEKDAQRNSKKTAQAKNKVTKCSGGRGVRTLTSSESQGMRKVVPISKLSRAGSSKRAERPLLHDGGETRRPLRDQSTPARGRTDKTARPPRHSSLPPDESKVQRMGGVTGSLSRWARDSMPRKASIHKPNAKPLRNIPKPAPEEKMCRSTMRALAQAQAQTQGGASSENSSSQTHSAKNSSDIPSFARNTVASTSRTRKELHPPSVPSTPSHSPSLLGRQSSAKQSVVSPTAHTSEEKPQGTSLRRVQSVKVSGRGAYRSETPPPPGPREEIRKTSSFSEKSTMPKDLLTSSRITKPSWK
ncbi:FH2 domain-containing protein 1 [Xenentodon cancila]